MRPAIEGFMSKTVRYPARGERIAAWVEAYMRERGLGVGELAFRVKADKRDLNRLLRDRSCGPRLNDALEEAFQWDFIEQVATPVVGADPITAREKELACERSELAARELHLQRLRAADRARSSAPDGVLRLVGDEDRSWASPLGIVGRGAGAEATVGDGGLTPESPRPNGRGGRR